MDRMRELMTGVGDTHENLGPGVDRAFGMNDQ